MVAQPFALQPSNASAPIDSDASLSDMGSQFTPPLVECQTPPVAVPSQTSLGFVGLAAITLARPLQFTRPSHFARPWPYVCPFKRAAGPIGNQLMPVIID